MRPIQNDEGIRVIVRILWLTRRRNGHRLDTMEFNPFASVRARLRLAGVRARTNTRKFQEWIMRFFWVRGARA